MTAPGPGRRASEALGERPLAPGGRDRGSRHCVGTQGPDDCPASSVSVGEGFVEEGALLTGRRSGGGAGSGAGGQCPRRAGGPGRQRAEPQCPGPEVGAGATARPTRPPPAVLLQVAALTAPFRTAAGASRAGGGREEQRPSWGPTWRRGRAVQASGPGTPSLSARCRASQGLPAQPPALPA